MGLSIAQTGGRAPRGGYLEFAIGTDDLLSVALVLNFVFPPRCGGCDRRLPQNTRSRLCAECLSRIRLIHDPLCSICGIPFEGAAESHLCGRCATHKPHFRRARAIASYRAAEDEDSDPLASMIRRHKYGLDQALGPVLVEALGHQLPVDREGYDVIMPVPLHSARLRWRGFNQAALLAGAVARELGGKLDVSSLVRMRATAAQTERGLEERRRNVQAAFIVMKPARIAAMRILLVDDVMTTGATVNECAKTLGEAGARWVDVLTLARAL